MKFLDVTRALGVQFKHEASPTSQKYLVETMGAGVALFDCDGDGRLDIFFVNGARIDDPMPKGALPVKDNPKYWNRLYHQNPNGIFEDITEKAIGIDSLLTIIGKPTLESAQAIFDHRDVRLLCVTGGPAVGRAARA